ncbi:MAG: IS21 family transposase, partial [Chloroflexi bacterium]|nr:IS21 family transposase [Chloroflexota bacterium]
TVSSCLPQPAKSHPLDIFRDQIKSWKKEETTRQVMLQMIRRTYPAVTESTLRRYIAKNFPEYRKPVMTRVHIRGDVMEVDFGSLGRVWNNDLMKHCTAWLFSARLRYSRKAYRAIVYDQAQETFFRCHMESFEYFGGVPRLVVCDNLKAAIIRAIIHNPLVNRAYRALAVHYGFHIDPNPPHSPNLKGGVENDVRYVKKNFLQMFKLMQRELGKTVIQSDDLEEALEKWSEELANTREVSGTGQSVPTLFAEERQSLRPLPLGRWETATFAVYPRLAEDYRVCFEKGFYSASYRLIGEEIMVKGTATEVSIFHNDQLHCVHKRVEKPWDFRRLEVHMPPEHIAELSWGRNAVIARAGFIGNYTSRLVDQLLSDKALDGLRPSRGLLRLADKYGTGRLEAACRRALHFEQAAYQYVKNILVRGMDRLPLEIGAERNGQLLLVELTAHRFVRKPSEYRAALSASNE